MPGTKLATPPPPGVSHFFSGLLGLVLGGLFFYAGLLKHLAPYAFAEAVLAYQLVPEPLAGLVAAILPWVEITPAFLLVVGYLLAAVGWGAVFCRMPAGAALVGGIKRRSCLLLLMAQAALFLIVLLITWARGLKIDCGCGLFTSREVGLVPVLEDALILGLAALVYWWEARETAD